MKNNILKKILRVFIVLLGIILFFKSLSNSKVLDSTIGLHEKKDNSMISDEDSGKCYTFNTPRTFLNFNSKINSDFKFSVEEDIGKHSSIGYLNNSYLLDLYNQLYVSDKLYSEVLNLEHPLFTDRYKKAKFINITLEKSEKIFGVAYDEVTTNRDLGESNCFISMKVSSSVYAKNNYTPAHELFHLYQYSVMMFKQKWLSEGLAQWSGSLFLDGTGEETRLPQDREQLLNLFDSSYEASKFWTRLFKLIDEDSEFEIPSHLNTITYTDGSPLIKDNKAYGVKFIPILFNELSIESKNVSDEKGWWQYAWKEKDQKSNDLNPYIWRAVKRAVYKTVPYEGQSEELRSCMEIEL